MQIITRKIELFAKAVIRNIKRKNNKNNTIIPHEQPKIEIDNNSNNRSLIVRFSNCGKNFLLNHILFRKQGPVFINTKSLKQNTNIKAQTSGEIQPLESYENNIVVFDDILLSKQKRNIDMFFTRGRHKNIYI